MSKIQSLCLTTQHINDLEKTLLFRLADVVGRELEVPDLRSCEKEYDENVHKFPRTAYNNHVVNELRIWEWDPYLDEWAKKTMNSFYELIFIPNNTKYDVDKVIRVLKDGLHISGYHGQKTLLVIDANELNYKVLEIDSSILKVNNNICRLNRTNNRINGYNLPKSDFISSEKVNVFSKNGERLQPKIIYKFLELMEPEFTVETKSFNEKIELFINHQLKIYDLTKANRRDIRSLFSEILSKYDEINNFFVKNNFDIINLEDNINQIQNRVNYILDKDNLRHRFCEAIVKGIPEVTEYFTLLIDEKYQKENANEIKRYNLTIQSKNREKEELENIIIKSRNTNDTLVAEQKKLEQKIFDMKSILESIEEASKLKLTQVKSDMSGFLSEMAVFGLLNEKGYRKNDVTLKISENIDSEEVDLLNSITEFADVLAINLEIAGIAKEYKSYASKYIISTILQTNNLVITGNVARDVSNAISATLCGRKADVIAFNTCNIEYDEIKKQIEKGRSKVIVIENIISQNEVITMQLFKSNFNKILIFANDISETINFIPNSFWDRSNLLCLDYISEMKKMEEYIYADAMGVDFSKKINKYSLKAAKEELQNLRGIGIYSRAHWGMKSELIALIDEFGDEEGMLTWFICDLIPHQILVNGKENIETILKKSSIFRQT